MSPLPGFHPSGAKHVVTPTELNAKLSLDRGNLLSNPIETVTRPDISYVVKTLTQYLDKPTKNHVQAALRVVKYIKNSPGQGLLFSCSNNMHLEGFCDANWAACLDTRSVTRYCIFLGDSLLTWKSKKQHTMFRSSAEAEYRSMAASVCELVWLKRLLKEMRYDHNAPTLLYCDNKVAVHIATNPVYNERTKHIEIDCHVVQERMQDGTVKLFHVNTKSQLADIFTKGLVISQFYSLLGKV